MRTALLQLLPHLLCHSLRAASHLARTSRLSCRGHPAVEEPRAQLPGAAGHAQGVHQGLTIRALPGAGEARRSAPESPWGGGQALAEGEAGVAVAAVEARPPRPWSR